VVKQIVHKVEDFMDRKDILCTTYQMRNFYQQFGDGFFSVLDVMNYIQHHQVVRMAKPGMNLLDMCCGRGLLLPMLRYQKTDLGSYTGIDIKKTNAMYRTKRVTDGKPVQAGYYPFPVHYVEGNVSEMSKLLPNDFFNFIVYTSSIEHMHPNDGTQSLYEARKVAAKGAKMFLTCPNTPEDQDGYDTQYAAHVYEWKQSEVLKGLKEAGWKVIDIYGLLADVNTIASNLSPDHAALFEQMRNYIPREWLVPMWASMIVDGAKELAYIAEAQ